MAYGLTRGLVEGARGALRERERRKERESDDRWKVWKAQRALEAEGMQRQRLELYQRQVGQQMEQAGTAEAHREAVTRPAAAATAAHRATMRPIEEREARQQVRGKRVEIRGRKQTLAEQAEENVRKAERHLWAQKQKEKDDAAFEAQKVGDFGWDLLGQKFGPEAIAKVRGQYGEEARYQDLIPPLDLLQPAAARIQGAQNQADALAAHGYEMLSQVQDPYEKLTIQLMAIYSPKDARAIGDKARADAETVRHHKEMEALGRTRAARGRAGGGGRAAAGRQAGAAPGGEFESGLQQLKSQGHKFTRVAVQEGVGTLRSDKPQKLATAARKMGYTALVDGKTVTLRLRGKTTLVGGIKEAPYKGPTFTGKKPHEWIGKWVAANPDGEVGQLVEEITEAGFKWHTGAINEAYRKARKKLGLE